MFVSFYYNVGTNEYMLEDTELGSVVRSACLYGIGYWINLVQIYIDNNMDVAKNLARAIVWNVKNKHLSLKAMLNCQNMSCKDKIPNWDKIVKEQTEHLEKCFLLW